MPHDYNFWVYIVTNRNHSVLYIGITNRLSRRTWEHREGNKPGFPSRYQCTKLIYYEHHHDIREAMAREFQLKKWSRAKKIGLVNRFNHAGRISVAMFYKTDESRCVSTSLDMTERANPPRLPRRPKAGSSKIKLSGKY